MGFRAEPVELLRERNCKDRIRDLLRVLSQLRLLLRLNCQNDFDGVGLSSAASDRNSFNLFFSVFCGVIFGGGEGITGLDLGDCLGTAEVSGGFLIWIGRSFPPEKSSSAVDNWGEKALPMQKLKSDPESSNEESNLWLWWWISSVWLIRSRENEIRAEQTSTAIAESGWRFQTFINAEKKENKKWWKRDGNGIS